MHALMVRASRPDAAATAGQPHGSLLSSYPSLMDKLREHRPDGSVVARSRKGLIFVSVVDGSPFATRSGDSFTFADRVVLNRMGGTHGRLGGTVVYARDAKSGKEFPLYWLETAVAE